MKSRILSTFLFTLLAVLWGKAFTQDLVNITITVTSVSHNFQCCTDAAGISCGFLPDRPEPRYRVRAQYIYGGTGAGFGTTSVINPGNGVSCGTISQNVSIMSVAGVCADEVEIDVDMWEEDGCGGDNTYNTGCLNDDENRTQISPNYLLSTLTPGSANTVVISGSNGYEVTCDITYDIISAPTNTSTTTSGCAGTNANLSATTTQTVGGMDFLWYDAAVGGNLVGSGSPFTPTLTTSTTYYVAYGNVSSCETDRTPVSVTVTPAPAPTGTGATICANNTAMISANSGSAIGYNWYDDASMTTLLGTGSSYTTPSLTTSTSYFVTATYSGGCESSPTQVDVTVESESTDPSSINASPSTPICPSGGPVSLAVIGGSLGAGANWVWYETGCGSGTSIGTGASISVSPSVTTIYYVRAEGSCNTTNCASVTVTVESLPTDPTSINASSSTACAGSTIILSVNGGSAGSGDWTWYEAGCGTGSPIGTGATISVAPTATTDYFVRAETPCGNSACVSTTIAFNAMVSGPTGATASLNNICPGDTTQLSVSGTALPADYAWVWYTAACGAVPVGVGTTLDVAPTATTTYYVAAVGTCGSSSCQSVTVTVLPGSVTPDGIITDNNNFCIGGSANLSVDGGSLESGASWTWYENSCGGSTPIGTGSSITVTPTSTTTYYVRGEGGTCGNTQCATISINVHGAQVYLVPFDTVCVDGNTSFNLTGGLPTGGTYSGTSVSGGVFNASTAGVGTHAVTYTYTDGFGCSNSATENIVVVEANTAATSVTADNNVVCNAGSAMLTVNGGNLVTGANWYWYQNSCGGGTPIGNGNSITVSPTQTTTYFVRAEGGNDFCGPTECVAITISVSNPSANLLPFDDVCEANTVMLTGGIPGGGVYSGTGVSGNSFDAAVAGTGTHTITYTYTDGNGCSASATEDITVVDGGVTATTSTEVETCANGGVLVYVSASGGTGNYTYVWSDGTTQNPHMWTEPGTYTVTVGDGSGCAAVVDSIEINDDLSSPCLELANTFTPNGDGTNDIWNLDFSSYSTATLEVYSRWGVLVYKTDGLIIQWDGNDMSGNALPAGTYYYIVDIDSGTMTQNGPISIVR